MNVILSKWRMASVYLSLIKPGGNIEGWPTRWVPLVMSNSREDVLRSAERVIKYEPKFYVAVVGLHPTGGLTTEALYGLVDPDDDIDGYLASAILHGPDSYDLFSAWTNAIRTPLQGWESPHYTDWNNQFIPEEAKADEQF